MIENREAPQGAINLDDLSQVQTGPIVEIEPLDMHALANEMNRALELEGESAKTRKRGPHPRFHHLD